MTIALFEDERWGDFAPLSTTRHIGELRLGSIPVFRHIAEALRQEVGLLGRSYLKAVARERTRLDYNDFDGGILVNARFNPFGDMKSLKKVGGKKSFAILQGEQVVAVSATAGDLEKVVSSDGVASQKGLKGLAKSLERLEAPEGALFSYPWDALRYNEEAIRATAGTPKGVRSVSPNATVEDFVSFDTRQGPVIIEEGAEIQAFSRLAGPCFIGRGAILRSALVGKGTSIGEQARVGGEVQDVIVYPHSNKAHGGFLGDSIVGEWVNIGAGAVTSNLKNTYGTVRVWRGKTRVDTGMTKLGSLIGDMAKVSIGTMVYAGKTLGVASQCSGTVESDVPEFSMYDGATRKTTRLWLDSVLETQKRMKSRRDLKLSSAERALITKLYSDSA